MPQGRKKEFRCRPSGRHQRFTAKRASAKWRFDISVRRTERAAKLDWKFPEALRISDDRRSRGQQSPLDARHRMADVLPMATRKTVRPAKSALSKGTVLAAKYRARANTLTDEERQAHRAQAMSHIYGNPHGPAVHARRG